MEHCGGLDYTGWSFPGGPAHRHYRLQSLSPDADFLHHQEPPGDHTELLQADCSMPGL